MGIDPSWDGTRKTYRIILMNDVFEIHPYDDVHCQGCEFYNFDNTMYRQHESCNLFNINWLPLDFDDPEKKAFRIKKCRDLAQKIQEDKNE